LQSQSVENIFSRSWYLLTKNWILIVPGIIVGLVLGVVHALFAPSASAYSDAPGLARAGSALVVGIISIAAFIITQCYTAGMAGAAWQRGTTTLEDGASSLREDAGNVFVAAIGLFVVGIIAAALAPFTLGLSLLLYYVFFIYTIAAAVVGNRPGFDALSESFRIARARFGPTLIIAILLFLIFIVGAIIGGALGFAPLIGPIVQEVIDQIVVAYATLVVVGEYLNLRGAPPTQSAP
jgi:hypothetical protein